MYLLKVKQYKNEKNWVAKIKNGFKYEFIKHKLTDDKSLAWEMNLFEENELYAVHTNNKTSYFRIEIDESEQKHRIALTRFDVEEILSSSDDPFYEVEMQSVEFAIKSDGPKGVVWFKKCKASVMSEIHVYENKSHYKIDGILDVTTEQYTRNFTSQKCYPTKSIKMKVLLHKQENQYRLRDSNGIWIENLQ